jgi:hypothetical protein
VDGPAGRRYRVATTDRHGLFAFSLVDTRSGVTVLPEGQPLDYYFAAAAMLERGLTLTQARALLAVRPIPKKCCG